jgi:hypothetical protein
MLSMTLSAIGSSVLTTFPLVSLILTSTSTVFLGTNKKVSSYISETDIFSSVKIQSSLVFVKIALLF